VTIVEISRLSHVMLHRQEVESLRCLGQKVFSECDEDEIQTIKDVGIYSAVTQHSVVVDDICFQYIEGNTGEFNFTYY